MRFHPTIFLLVAFVFSFLIYAFISAHYWGKAKEEMRLNYQISQSESVKTLERPLPKKFVLLPSTIMNLETGFQRFGYDRESKKLRHKNRLSIIKEGNNFIWESNENRKLMHFLTMTTGVGRLDLRRTSFLVPFDASGLIIIKHDGYKRRGSCDYAGGRQAEYAEFQFQGVFEIRRGLSKFFPPRSSDWCDTLQDKFIEMKNNYSLINEIRKDIKWLKQDR